MTEKTEELDDRGKIAKLGQYSWQLRHGVRELLESGDWNDEDLEGAVTAAEQEYADKRKEAQKKLHSRRIARSF